MVAEEIVELVEKLTIYNKAYRSGRPLVPDQIYDDLVEQLRLHSPEHAFLKKVEPEDFAIKQKLKHPYPMLSIQKAYNSKELSLFVARAEKVAVEIGVTPIYFRVTAKLDGVAGRYDGGHLVTRGDGLYGFDITSVFEKGVVAVNGRRNGLGEVVMQASYFDAHLAEVFEHPRNLVVGIIGSDTVNEKAQRALDDGAVHFIRYADLPGWHGSGDELLQGVETIYHDVLEEVDYPVDGIVIQSTHEKLKKNLGATTHHYRWQIAYKKRGETAPSTVASITWQVGRTGNITPVLVVDPIRLSGATINRVTAHHAGMIKKLGITVGTRIEIIRSGEVIPKLEAVLGDEGDAEIPRDCPSCGKTLNWRGDFLRCSNQTDCRDQIVARLHHWFHILDNADWFGIKTIEKLVENGMDRLDKIYAATAQDFQDFGFGPIQSKNLLDACRLSLSQPVEDWRLLAAMGISSLGVGESRKLLAFFPLESLWDQGWKQIAAIKGFGEIKAHAIMGGLADFIETYCDIMDMGFHLIRTPSVETVKTVSTPILGKGIVFTGKMSQGTRAEMQEQARRLGAKVQSQVSKATDFLVCGSKVGQSKIENARLHGTVVITEAEFTEMIRGTEPSFE